MMLHDENWHTLPLQFQVFRSVLNYNYQPLTNPLPAYSLAGRPLVQARSPVYCRYYWIANGKIQWKKYVPVHNSWLVLYSDAKQEIQIVGTVRHHFEYCNAVDFTSVEYLLESNRGQLTGTKLILRVACITQTPSMLDGEEAPDVEMRI